MSPRRHGRSGGPRSHGGGGHGGGGHGGRGRGDRGGSGPTRGVDPGAVWGEQLESGADGDWRVRRVTGAAAGKPYRCPGCDQLIPSGVPHVVVWPDDGAGGGVEDRRHWHTVCWDARHRRRPRRRL